MSKQNFKRAVQKYNFEYVENSRKLSATDRIRFVEEFMKMSSAVLDAKKTRKSRLISLKVSEDLLQSFKTICLQENIRYQTQIKKLMRDWLLKK